MMMPIFTSVIMMVETAVEESQIIAMFVSVLVEVCLGEVGELQPLQLIVGHVINHLGLVMDTVMIQQIVKCVNMMVAIAVEVM